MPRPHWHTRRDKGQRELLKQLNELPFLRAYDISTVPDSQCPGDILVCDVPRGLWKPYEVKSGSGAAVSGEQRRNAALVPIVYGLDGVLRDLGRARDDAARVTV
jgi:hypothetical protein